nr:Gfo/Idh/MocA family oxidoreductase [Micromonospora sp. DSM 115978]
MSTAERLRVALVGCGRRGRETYLPVLSTMSGHFSLVAVCDPVDAVLRPAAARYGVPGFGHLDDLLEKTRPDVCVLAVTPPPSPANGHVLARCLEAGVAVLAETPIALTLDEADRIVDLADKATAPVTVAENYPRTPRRRLMTLLVEAGVFGPVNVVYADFVGHGYHGISVIRSYVGPAEPVVAVRGDRHEFPVTPHAARPGEPPQGTELWQFGVLEFGNSARGVFSFSTLAYHSAMRPRRHAQVRFLAGRGMGVGDDLMVLDPSGSASTVDVVATHEVVGGRRVLTALTAPAAGVTWENPLRAYPLVGGDQHSPLTIGLQLLGLHRTATGDAEPEYGVVAARYDRLVDLALQRSWETGLEVRIPAVPPA